MSKIDNLVINDIKMLSLDMIKEAGSGNSGLQLNVAGVFYSLFMNNLKYDKDNIDWINRDRIFISNKLLPAFYATQNLFGFDMPIDNLKEFKKLNSSVPGFKYSSNVFGDIIGYATGNALGERYLNALVKAEDAKSKIIDFHTLCLCTWDDLVSGTAFESLSFASHEKLNKLIVIVIKDEFGNDTKKSVVYDNNLQDYLEELNIDVISAKSNNLSSIDEALNDALSNNAPSVILVDSYYDKNLQENNYNRVLTNEELNTLRTKYKMAELFTIPDEHYQEVNKNVTKRLSKEIEKWRNLKNNNSNSKIKNIIEFLEKKEININFNVDNIKINDNYEEDLIVGNNKIFNIYASKSPFILSLSNDNFSNNLGNIKSSNIMSKTTPTERNIYFGGRTLAMATIANGLAGLGFKVFVNCPLVDSNLIKPFIKYSAFEDLDVHYLFTHDTFLNTYESLGISAIDEINSFRLIPKLITFRPADINEIIGVYNILANYKKTTITVIGSGIVPKMLGTNPKYVVAGAYRVKRERGEANGIIIATGTEVNIALKIAEELLSFGIDLRVVTMPCMELFANQSSRYQYTLLPKELKTFVIEFGSSGIWYKYATGEEYILGLDRYATSGTKEELLNKYNLDIDSIKTRIIELMKK